MLLAVGLSHKTTPLEVRERFFLRPMEQEALLSRLCGDPLVVEAFVLCTCHRIEVYARLIDDDPSVLWGGLARVKGREDIDGPIPGGYVLRGEGMVRHLLRVACGLDSMVVGEEQILGQVRDAAERARRLGTMQKALNVLTQTAVRTGKIARATTEIGAGGLSVGWAAVEAAERMLDGLEGKKVAVIGAGVMGAQAGSQSARRGAAEIWVVNRSREKGESLAAGIGGRAAAFWELAEVLQKADAVICCAGAPHYVVERDLIETVLDRRAGRPLLLIDISTPRNICPTVGGVQGARLLGLGDLEEVVQETLFRRRAAVGEVEDLVERKVKAFFRKTSHSVRDEGGRGLVVAESLR